MSMLTQTQDTIVLSFNTIDLGGAAQELSAAIPGSGRVLVQNCGVYPVHVSQTQGKGTAGIPVLPYDSQLLDLGAGAYVTSPWGDTVVFMTRVTETA